MPGDHLRRSESTRTVTERRLECSITVAQQHTYFAGWVATVLIEVGHNYVGMAVVIYITNRHGKGLIPARAVNDRLCKLHEWLLRFGRQLLDRSLRGVLGLMKH